MGCLVFLLNEDFFIEQYNETINIFRQNERKKEKYIYSIRSKKNRPELVQLVHIKKCRVTRYRAIKNK